MSNSDDTNNDEALISMGELSERESGDTIREGHRNIHVPRIEDPWMTIQYLEHMFDTLQISSLKRVYDTRLVFRRLCDAV